MSVWSALGVGLPLIYGRADAPADLAAAFLLARGAMLIDPDAPVAEALMTAEPAAERFPVTLIVGLSGAGRSTALGALEDEGLYVVDNPPHELLEAVVEAARRRAAPGLAAALGPPLSGLPLDRDALIDAVAALRLRPDLSVSLLFLDAEESTLARRYKETRRRHPLAPQGSVEEGLAREWELLRPLKAQADAAIDTTSLTPTDLRREMSRRYARRQSRSLSVSLLSFGFKKGAPREADLMFDARFLSNPYWRADLRALSGLDAAVRGYIEADPNAGPFLQKLEDLLRFLLPLYEREGKSYLSIAVGCTGGQHRSVFVVEHLAAALRGAGLSPYVRHRDMKPAPGADESPQGGS